MRSIVASFGLFALLAGTAMPHPSSAQTPQQERMKSCNAQAGTQKLAGDARKSFMSDCLSGKAATPATAPQTPQERMKSCNTQASTQKITGDQRKAFMSTCLRG